MNKVQLVGRLTKDPEMKLTTNQTQVCNFTVAVDRKYTDVDGQRQADFISCVAWKHTAVFIQKYFHKGNRIGICGSIQTRSYEDQNGQNHFITEVLAEEVEFVESKEKSLQEEKIESEAPIEVNPNTGEVMNDGGTLPFEI